MAIVKVMSAGAVESMVKALGAEFERDSGHKLNLVFNTAGNLRERFQNGEEPDLLILPQTAMAEYEKQGRLVPGSRTDLGRTVTGVAVREGAPVPDISTPESFKQVLLKANGVAYSDPRAGGSSGTFFAGLLQKMGIAEQVNKNVFLGKRGYEVAQAVADGRVEIGTTFISEMLTVRGVTIVGPLPGPMANTNTYTAAIPAGSEHRDGAAALLRALTDPASATRWTKAGLEPAFLK